ncbi:hypothetical protein EIP91_003659 [Steccherinum ochraceum]|uniref:Uncharacterized protein n=1 Tax=Steccherinum ochraceum TaxID=92696 RepID=A0A4R0RLR4_9APHY|nr:hypothetical protein EIP91_003659 [Steccherinum ochraceum]
MRFTAATSLCFLSVLLASSCTTNAWVLPGYDRLVKSITLQFDSPESASEIVNTLFATGDSEDDADANLFISCQNAGPLHQRAWADQGCDPDRHQSFQSSHNCANTGGRAYFCYRDGHSVCVRGKGNMVAANYENGECFK